MVSAEKAADFISKNFPNCPLCRSRSDFNNYKMSFDNYVECKSCGAKWHLLYNSKEMILKRSSNDFAGDYLLGIKKPVAFWQSCDPDRIDWDKTTKPSSSVLRGIYLEEGERILTTWKGNKLTKTGGGYAPIGGITVWRDGEYVPSYGSLILTNQRILWFEKHKTLPQMKLIDTVLFEDVTQILQKHFTDYEGVDIKDNKGNTYSYRLARMLEYPSCKPLIEKAIQERKEQIKSQKMKERIHVVLDFSFLKDYMKKGGLVLQTFRCPHCNAPVKLPSSGNQTECKHCGNTVYAQDIFEKVKELIG
jgi:transcription elongation factor Elf1